MSKYHNMTSVIREGSQISFEFDMKPFGHELFEYETDLESRTLYNIRQALGTLATKGKMEKARTRVDNAYANLDFFNTEGFWRSPESPIASLIEAPDIELKRFIELNASYHGELQAVLKDMLPDLRAGVRSGARRLQDIGYLNEEQAGNYSFALDNTPHPKALDTFTAAMQGARGICEIEDGQIGMSHLDSFISRQNIFPYFNNVQKTFFHEYTHALGAVMIRGFVARQPASYFLEEVSASHATAVAYDIYPNPDIVDPGIRLETLSYPLELSFLAYLLEDEVTLKDVVNSFHHDKPNNIRLYAGLNKAIKRLEKTDMATWEDFNSAYNSTPTDDRNDYMSNLLEHVYRSNGSHMSEDIAPGEYPIFALTEVQDL